jgi:hypothetical protein
MKPGAVEVGAVDYITKPISLPIVKGWRKVASSKGFKKEEIERMSSAFDHEELKKWI